MAKRILFVGVEFEQAFYQGTSHHAAAVVRAAAELGHECTLLTTAPRTRSECLQELKITQNFDRPAKITRRQLPRRWLSDVLGLNPFKLHERQYIQEFDERLRYLKYVRGYLNKPGFHRMVSVQTAVFNRPYTLDPPGHFDTIFTTAPFNIRSSSRLVQSLHDLAPLIRQDHPPEDDAKLFYRRVRSMLEHSDQVLTISEHARQDLLRVFPGYGDKVLNAYLPIPIFQEDLVEAGSEHTQRAVLEKFKLESGRFLLYIGSLDKRKNIGRLVESHLAVHHRVRMPLVLAGSTGNTPAHVLKLIQQDHRIHYLDYVAPIDKLVLLAHSAAFLFPSLYEGFGLPPLEAMKMGCPVLTSSVSALPEVCGDAALYVDPGSHDAIAGGILELTENTELRGELIRKGFRQAARFDFESYKERIAPYL